MTNRKLETYEFADMMATFCLAYLFNEDKPEPAIRGAAYRMLHRMTAPRIQEVLKNVLRSKDPLKLINSRIEHIHESMELDAFLAMGTELGEAPCIFQSD